MQKEREEPGDKSAFPVLTETKPREIYDALRETIAEIRISHEGAEISEKRRTDRQTDRQTGRRTDGTGSCFVERTRLIKRK